MKLTIEQLRNYLGTGLKVLNGWGDIKNLSYIHLDDEGNGGDIFFIKPICYRLSDLDKEIEVDGERFVPAKELAKLITQSGWGYENIVGISSEDNTIIVKWPIHVINFTEHQNFFEIDTDEDFGFNIYQKRTDTVYRHREDEVQYLTGNIWQMYQKLFEWHFWSFGDEYFEQGLVIDKMKL